MALLKCHSSVLTHSKRADGLGKSLSGLWLQEVSKAGTEAVTVRAIVSEVLTVMEGLSWHTDVCPVGPCNSTYQSLNSPLRNTSTDRTAAMWKPLDDGILVRNVV